MKSLQVLLLALSVVLVAGCDRATDTPTSVQTAEPMTQRANESDAAALQAGSSKELRMVTQQVSLKQVDQARSMAEAMDRKILRDGQLTLESSAPADAQRRIVSIAESLGGFVVTSESKQHQDADSTKRELEVTLVVRVPAEQFASAVDQIRAVGTRVIQEKVTGQDVTEEFIDLAARIKTQKALEAQFLEIMKRANKVEEALDVQRQIAEVRSEIERLEGRNRFLENRAALSTITIKLEPPPAMVVSTSSFRRSIREATGDGIDIVAGLVLFMIRFVIVVTPILLLVILPCWLITRYALRRRRLKVSRQLQSQPG